MTEKHSRIVNGQRAVWYSERLCELTRDLAVFSIEIARIAEFDENCWFDTSDQPTCRAVAEHARKIANADMRFPIILSSDGRLMDGGHRIAKAWLQGQKMIDAVQFETDPEPDYFVPIGYD
ncbi:MAG TPA: hypothetical protein VEV84_10930 [Pyrinomonadaceae bacterium]|nr:hypothetical protein [Pyrinomonadaceae bacterium]